jgi:hypothetical protein
MEHTDHGQFVIINSKIEAALTIWEGAQAFRDIVAWNTGEPRRRKGTHFRLELEHEAIGGIRAPAFMQ